MMILGLGVIYMVDHDKFYCRMTTTYITLYECVILCMLGVFYSHAEFALVSYDEMWVRGLYSLNAQYVSGS